MRNKISRLLREKTRISISELQAYFPGEPKETVYGEVIAMQFEGLLKLDYEPVLILKDE